MALSFRIADSASAELPAAAFLRHRGPVTCIAPIPGSAAAVTSGYDGAVGWVDLEAGFIELLGHHDHLVNKITVNPSGTQAASSSSDFTIGLWDLRSRRLERRLLGHSDDVEDFAYAEGGLGISVSRDRRILVWDLKTAAIVRSIEEHEKDVLSVSYHDGRIYSCGDDMTLRVWDLATGRRLRKFGPFACETDSCDIDPVHGRAVLGCDDGKIRVFDFETGTTVVEFEAHAKGIKKVATSRVTGDILSAGYDRQARIWSSADFGLRVAIDAKSAMWERSFNWSADGLRILAGTFDGTVLEWDAGNGRCLREIGDPGMGNACFNDVAVNAAGDIATVSDDGVVRLGRLTRADSRWTSEVVPACGRVLSNAVTFDDEDGRVLCGTHGQALHIFERTEHGLVGAASLRLDEGPINCVRISRRPGNEGEAFVACYSGAIVRVDRKGGVRGILRIHEGAVKALRLHSTRPIGVSCSADGAVLAWSLSGEVLARFPGHIEIVNDVGLDPSGSRIASISRDFSLKLYELESGRLLRSIFLGRRSPKCLCFLDASTVLVGNYWGELLNVDLETGRVRRQSIASNGISAIAPNGTEVVVVSYDGCAYLVDPKDLEVLGTLRAMRQRPVESVPR